MVVNRMQYIAFIWMCFRKRSERHNSPSSWSPVLLKPIIGRNISFYCINFGCIKLNLIRACYYQFIILPLRSYPGHLYYMWFLNLIKDNYVMQLCLQMILLTYSFYLVRPSKRPILSYYKNSTVNPSSVTCNIASSCICFFILSLLFQDSHSTKLVGAWAVVEGRWHFLVFSHWASTVWKKVTLDVWIIKIERSSKSLTSEKECIQVLKELICNYLLISYCCSGSSVNIWVLNLLKFCVLFLVELLYGDLVL